MAARKLAAVTAVACLLTAQPALAQKAGSGPVPPQVDLNRPLVNDTEQPPPTIPYTQKTPCIASLNDGTVVLANKPWGQQQLQIEQAHQFATGKNQTVAVIDTGVRVHEYLQNRLIKGPDYVNKQQSDSTQDCDGHGTEVAGIIAARTDGTQIGFTGVAPDAQILAIRQSSERYAGTPTDEPNAGERPAGDLNTLAQAIRHAADDPRVTVINMSVDNCRPATEAINPAELDLQRMLRYAVDKNKVVVASAGNKDSRFCQDPSNGRDPAKPTAIITPPWFADDVLSVAAIDRRGALADFSMQGPWVSVAGPGTEIVSLDPSGKLANLTIDGGKQIQIQGTSFAAPYVAGLAALVRERFPTLNARQVMNRIKMTAQHPAAPGGRDSMVGYGMINPVAALTAFIPSESNIGPDKPQALPPNMPPIKERDWSSMNVALIGTGSGIALLLLTLFVMHAIRRSRKTQPE
ncbi:type VII secretion-associated serine protease mycosin [Actinocrispum wychmicini]|uniref:Membrane-anchored mycosin MYCP n=1 Tax=Actinocrispum wychmicini TaxID=1213861 RepID=A0A4R2K121_9PSEU|nr:type VII secretion-associated serine protease mycosin [Actinocrispum wychmicini]TCO65377.1 membrane-anchored mycosin MYCP [Actinocrispum wychmicini]